MKSRIVSCTEVIGKHFFIWTAAICLLATGCGGSSSSDPAPPVPGPTYEGKTTPVMLDEDNAKPISGGAMEAQSNSNSDNIRSANSLTDGSRSANGQDLPILVNLSMAAKNAVIQSEDETDTGLTRTAVVRKQPEERPGNKGGSVIYDIEFNKDTGEFSGTAIYKDYCNDDSTANGDAIISGALNKETGHVESMSMTFLDVVLKYETKSMKFENLEYFLKENDNQIEFEMNGRFYHSDHGYVDVNTSSPFVMENNDSQPNSGVMELTGENGEAGGPTKAKLTAISNTQCRVEADANGDGEYDYDSGIILWDELSEDDSEGIDTDDHKQMEINVDSCFKLSTATAKDGSCTGEDDGDIYFWEGANVDIFSDNEIFCLLEGEFTDLESVPSDYSECDWTHYVEGMSGLENTGLIVQDVSSTHYYKMRIIDNELPQITFEYEEID
jgi:hypothetical protein